MTPFMKIKIEEANRKRKEGPTDKELLKLAKKRAVITNPSKFFKVEHPFFLILAYKDWVNVGYQLSKGIEEATNWSSRCINCGGAGRFSYPSDLEAKRINQGEIRALCEQADFVLYGSSFYNWNPAGYAPDKDTPRGIWHGGTTFRRFHNQFNYHVHPHFDLVFAHADLQPLYKESKIIQQPIDLNKWTVVEKDFCERPFIVSHSPSNAKRKGTKEFQKAMKILKRKYGDEIQFDLYQNVDRGEIYHKKRSNHMHFDQIGGYHIPPHCRFGYGLSAVENAACEQIVMVRHDLQALDCPFINVKGADDIVATVDEYFNDPALARKKAKECREYVERMHDRNVLGQAVIHHVEEFLNDGSVDMGVETRFTVDGKDVTIPLKIQLRRDIKHEKAVDKLVNILPWAQHSFAEERDDI